MNLCGEVLRMLLMALRSKRRGWNAVAIALLLTSCAAQAAKHEADAKSPESGHAAVPAPVARIAVGQLGFLAPSAAYLNLRLAWASLNFIDNNHLLFTFHTNGLLQRIPDDPLDDEDQMIHADVLEIGSGRVLRQADWRMHDRGRYLWALQDGKFLVRERDSLFLTDNSLELRPYLIFKTDLQGVEVSPGRGMMMLEVKKLLPPEESDSGGDAPSLFQPSLGSPVQVRQRRTEMMLLRPGERAVLAEAEIRDPIPVPLLEDGILEVIEGKQSKQWLIEREMTNKTTEQVGEVRSGCTPQLQALSRNVVLAQDCPVNGASGSMVSALSLAGEVLWEGLWQSKYIWPTFDYAEDGSRFAYESLEMNRSIGTMDAFGESDVVAQPVGVFDTESGKLELVLNASPILSEGQNFALSADGRRFAILREGAIEVYDLPPVEAKEPVATAAKGKK